jgi:hypothetical protein
MKLLFLMRYKLFVGSLFANCFLIRSSRLKLLKLSYISELLMLLGIRQNFKPHDRITFSLFVRSRFDKFVIPKLLIELKHFGRLLCL